MALVIAVASFAGELRTKIENANRSQRQQLPLVLLLLPVVEYCAAVASLLQMNETSHVM